MKATACFLLLAASAAAVHAALQPDIRADTNRDGVVDITGSSDSRDKAFWTHERGAIFLPNIGDKHLRCPTTDAIGNTLSNDELASCHDASGHLLLAPEYVAPLRTLPMDVPDSAEARIYATPRAAYERVRLFLLEDGSDVNSTSSWRLIDQEFTFNATSLKSGVTLGLDGRELVTDASVWDGSVTIEFKVTDGSDSAADGVALRMAPALTHHHLQKVETLVSTSGNGTDQTQEHFIHQLEEARVNVGIDNPLLLFNQSDDIWAQDIIEPAYVSMPGPDGPISLRVILRSAQSTRTGGRQVFEQLRGPGVGGFQPLSGTGSGFGHREINSYGNLETIPPYISKSGVRYNAGRIIMGKHFSRIPAILDFLYGQQLQAPLVLEAGWLLIGHVDEFVQFLPYENKLGFTVAIADTRSGINLLKHIEKRGHGHVAAVSFNGTDIREPGMGDTVSEILSNETFVEANTYAQKHLDANLRILLSEIPIDPQDVIYMPTLFRDANFEIPSEDGLPPHSSPLPRGERHLVALHPASINGIVVGDQYLSPKPWGPVVDGEDLLESAIEAAYERAGMRVGYVDDFMSHHIMGGEIHCGSNTLRQTDLAWWE